MICFDFRKAVKVLTSKEIDGLWGVNQLAKWYVDILKDYPQVNTRSLNAKLKAASDYAKLMGYYEGEKTNYQPVVYIPRSKNNEEWLAALYENQQRLAPPTTTQSEEGCVETDSEQQSRVSD